MPAQVAAALSHGGAVEEADADRLPHHHRPRRADQGRHRRRCTARRWERRRRRRPRRRWAGTIRPSRCRTGWPRRWREAGGARRPPPPRLAQAAGAPPAARRVRARDGWPVAGQLPRGDGGAAGRAGRTHARRCRPVRRARRVLEALVPALPELVGGSADLTGSQPDAGQAAWHRAAGQLWRALHALRRARARHGGGDERHGAAWRPDPVRRHLLRASPTTCARRCGWRR